jgi:hypothetical protein
MFFPPRSQMIAIAILKVTAVIVLLYLGYSLILSNTPFGDKEAFESPALGVPAPAYLPPTLPVEVVEPERTIQPSGPSAPSQAAPLDRARIVLSPQATDPYAEHNEGANAPENLRYPERMFRPAPANDAVDMIVDSGIGGMAQQQTANANETFAPDFAQNGGNFMGGVFANDMDIPTNYSDF